MSRRSIALVVALVALTAPPALTLATDASIEPGPTVSLRGAFGTVVGSDPAAPAVAAPDDRPLDTWARETILELTVDPPVDPTAVTVAATARGAAEAVELPLEDGRWLRAPDRAGEHVLVVTVTHDDGEATQHAWLLEVPDRPGDFETWLRLPPIEARVETASGAVMGERGHGCLVDLCQEVGFRPPAEALESLTVAVGEPLRLVLDDGSAMVHWEGRLEPQAGTAAETRLAAATFDTPVAGPLLTGLEPDAPGEWLLELRVDYDRQRGWQWFLFRLVAE